MLRMNLNKIIFFGGEFELKYLNRNFCTSPLNRKIRKWYQIKQDANNMIKDKEIKKCVMKYCDKQINHCWRRSYVGLKGYEINTKE